MTYELNIYCEKALPFLFLLWPQRYYDWSCSDHIILVNERSHTVSFDSFESNLNRIGHAK